MQPIESLPIAATDGGGHMIANQMIIPTTSSNVVTFEVASSNAAYDNGYYYWTIPELIGKNNFIIAAFPLSTIRVSNTITHIICIDGTLHAYNIDSEGLNAVLEKHVASVSFDNATGKVSWWGSIANRYKYEGVAW